MRARIESTKDRLDNIPPEAIPVGQVWPIQLSKASEYLAYAATATGMLVMGPIFVGMMLLMQLMHFLVSVTGPLSEVLHIPIRLMSEEEDEKLRATYLDPATPAYQLRQRAQQRINERLERERNKYSTIDRKRKIEASKTMTPK
jgi:hypothetical protein